MRKLALTAPTGARPAGRLAAVVPALAALALGVPALGVPAHGVPAHGVPAHGVPAHGVPAHGVPAHGVVAAPAAAEAATTVPIGPHTPFGATVNEQPSPAVIHMACFGPVRPGQTGHPMARQVLEVFVPEVMVSPTFGTTGAHGRAIVARLVRPDGGTQRLARFRGWRIGPLRTATATLSTRLELPCSGGGRVVFSPSPWSTGAKSATVDVTFAGQP